MIKCVTCNQNLPETEFWEVRIGPKGQYKRHNKCKECCLKSIDIYDYKSIIPLLQELNFPYIKEQLATIYQRWWDKDPSCRRTISQYISKMKLMSFRDFTFEDSEQLNWLDAERIRIAEEKYGKI